MGFFDWLKTWLRPQQPTRDIAGLSGTEASLTQEVVDTSGGPLKQQHRRLALRDRRLLPKPKSKIARSAWAQPKKPKIIPTEEANRLFSETMRTRNRSIRDLATDEEQLGRYGLPTWRSEADVAAALDLSLTQLRHYSIHRQRETTPHYVTFAIPKRSGGHRLIYAPKKRLKSIQRRLDAKLVSKLPVSKYAHGFRTGRSVASNARPHVGKAIVIKLDIEDCFPTIHFGRIRGLLIALGYSYPVATTLSVLMTEAPRQPVEAEGKVYHVPVGPRVCVQGAPTSPGVCNAVLTRLDRRIAGLARNHGFHYTRYADDLTLSGDDHSQVKLLVTIAAKIARDEGFRLNKQKTRVLRKGRRQQVTGVVVNDQMGLSRTERRRMRAAIHQLQAEDHEARKRLEGRIAYLSMLSPEQAAPLQEALRASSSG